MLGSGENMPVKKRILVVDDDDSMLNLYQRVFTDSGYDIDFADTISAALGLLGKSDYDLMVTDYMFPDGLGTDLIRDFEEKYGGKKCMLVSGSTTAPDPGKYPSLVAFYGKPFPIKMFLEAVARALA